MSGTGLIGRLGRWSATHGRIVAVTWIVLIVGLGALAPRVETALSGAGWEDSGSESVQVRDTVQRSFDGAASSALVAAFTLIAARAHGHELVASLCDAR